MTEAHSFFKTVKIDHRFTGQPLTAAYPSRSPTPCHLPPISTEIPLPPQYEEIMLLVFTPNGRRDAHNPPAEAIVL
jgi:hypothetical protein